MDNFDSAFNHMVIGNDLNRSKIKYNIEKDIQLFKQIKKSFSGFNFDFKPNVSVKEGVKNFVNWYVQYHD